MGATFFVPLLAGPGTLESNDLNRKLDGAAHAQAALYHHQDVAAVSTMCIAAKANTWLPDKTLPRLVGWLLGQHALSKNVSIATPRRHGTQNNQLPSCTLRDSLHHSVGARYVSTQ